MTLSHVKDSDEKNHLIDAKHASPTKKKEMPIGEFTGIVVLIILYTLQGIPMGFFGRTIHVLFLENGAQTADLGTLSLASLPYSIKFLVAPFMDTYYFRNFGKRKSYIIPMQYLFSILCFVLWYCIQYEIKSLNVTAVFVFGLVSNIIMAIQDVAVDGWVLTMLSQESLAYGSLAQSIGLTFGGIIAFNMFIPLNSVSFCNDYFFTTPREEPLLGVNQFWLWVGVITVVVTLFTHFFKKEKVTPDEHVTSAWEVIKSMKAFYKNPNLRQLVLVVTTGYFVVIPIYGLVDTKLIQKNFPKETLTNISTALIPVNIFASFLVSKLCKRKLEMKVKLYAYLASYVHCVFMFWVGLRFDLETNYAETFWYVLIGNIVGTFIGCAHFIANGSYYNRICDENTGATFLTVLAALGNLSFLWPRSLVLFINHYVAWEYLGLFTVIGTPIYLIWYSRQVNQLHKKTAKDFMAGVNSVSAKSL